MLLLDAPVRVGGGLGFRDHLDPRRRHALPGPPVVRAAALEEGLSLALDVPRPEAADDDRILLAVETTRVELVRLEARRRAGADAGDRPFAVARSLLGAEVPGGQGQIELRGAVEARDEAMVRRALEGGPTPLLVVARYRLRGLEAPVDARLRLHPERARSRLREELPGPALQLGGDLSRWTEVLIEEGALELEADRDAAEVRRLAERVVGSLLFEPEVSPAVLSPAALDEGLAAALEGGDRGSVGLRLRSTSASASGSGPAETIELDARRGLVLTRVLLARAPLLGPLPPLPRSAPSLRAAGDWTDVAAIDVELEGSSEVRVLTEETPTAALPETSAPRLRARARLVEAPAAELLELPVWSEWMTAPAGPFDPARLARRRRLRCGFGWVDSALVARASVRLSGPRGRVELTLDGAAPEVERTVIGEPERAEAEVVTGGGSTFKEGLTVAAGSSSMVIPQPSALPAPVVVRLSDPRGRYRFLEVDLESDSGFGRRTFRLSAGAPEAVWTPPDGPEGFRYRLDARLADGRSIKTPLQAGPAGTLTVGEPGVELRVAEVGVGPEVQGGAWLVVEAGAPPEGGGTAVEIFLERGETRHVELPFSVDAPSEMSVFGERYDARGQGAAIPLQTVRGLVWLVD